MNVFAFVLVALGSYLLYTNCLPGVYHPADVALRHRTPKPLTQTEILTQKLAGWLTPLIDIEPLKRIKTEELLRSLGHAESPEMYQATALAKSLMVSIAFLAIIPFSPVLGLALTAVVCLSLYSSQDKKLNKEMAERRQRIERELPQFASTIRQALNSTHDVAAILSVYRKICGVALRTEIDHTLNDIITGNTERALKAMESRVASAKLGQLISGLVAVHRGDDQRIYFDMLAAEFRKSQNEAVAKALLKRPSELNVNMGLLFAGMALMIAAALGTYLTQQLSLLFT